MSQYLPPYKFSGRNIKVELDLSSYATKADLKNVTHVDVSSFATTENLASLKTEVDKIEIAKFTPVPDDLAKLNNEIKNDVVKKTEYNKLVTKVDNIDTKGLIQLLILLLQKAKEKYDNGGKEIAVKYYQDKKEVIKKKATDKFKNLTEEEKEAKRQYSKNRYNKMKEK